MSYTLPLTEPYTTSFSTCCTVWLPRVLLRGLQGQPWGIILASDDECQPDSPDRSLLESKQWGTLLTTFPDPRGPHSRTRESRILVPQL